MSQNHSPSEEHRPPFGGKNFLTPQKQRHSASSSYISPQVFHAQHPLLVMICLDSEISDTVTCNVDGAHFRLQITYIQHVALKIALTQHSPLPTTAFSSFEAFPNDR